MPACMKQVPWVTLLIGRQRLINSTFLETDSINFNGWWCIRCRYVSRRKEELM